MTFNRLFLLVVCVLTPFIVFSNCDFEPDNFHDENRQRDFEAVQQFVNEKRLVPLKEQNISLKITGDIRSAYFLRTETQDGKHLRGHGAVDSRGIAISKSHFDVVLNLRFDYRTPRAWSHAHLEFNEFAGIGEQNFTCKSNRHGMFGSGCCNELCLKRCYLGYNLYECKDSFIIDVEVGRRPLFAVFESYIEFKNRFDGILFKFKKKLKPSSEFYINISPFIVDERVNHYAYVGETGWMNIMDLKFDAKYSYIDWTKNGHNRCGVSHALGNRFRISQFYGAYNFNPKVFNYIAKFYGAYLINHAAKKLAITNHRRENRGWYAGFIIGEVEKKGDWSLDIDYQWVQALSIPDSDVNGIDRGNILGETFTANRRGKTNYKGWQFEALYAVTDHLTLDILYEFSREIDAKIGGRHRYSKFEFDVILDF